jgi:hypothetical protein
VKEETNMSQQETSNAVEVHRPLTPAEVSWKTAQRIANTPFVPTAFRGKPESVFAAVLYGEELGLGPMQSLNSIHVIEGKPSMAPELMRALVFKAGHRIDVKVCMNDEVILYGCRADSGSEATVKWTMKDAQNAGLAGRGAWKTYPRAMLLARATSELCRMLFADVVAGLSYTPEEAASIAGSDWEEVPAEPPVFIEKPTTIPNQPEPPVEAVVETSWEEAFPGSDIVDAEIIEDQRPETVYPEEIADPNMATPKQIGMARALLREWGIVNKAESINLAEMVLNRTVTSMADMSKKEISAFIKHLQVNHPDGDKS